MPPRLRRYDGAGCLHFITSSCYQRQPLLDSAQNRNLFLRVLEQVRRLYDFVVVGYVVMLEHIHLLLSEPERDNPSVVMQAPKQGFARRRWRWSSYRNYAYGEAGPALVNEQKKAELKVRRAGATLWSMQPHLGGL